MPKNVKKVITVSIRRFKNDEKTSGFTHPQTVDLFRKLEWISADNLRTNFGAFYAGPTPYVTLDNVKDANFQI